MTGWGEYDAARFLLETPLIASRTAPFVGEQSFDWTGLFTAMRPWSHGEQLLVRAAFSLWRGHNDDATAETVDGDEVVLVGVSLGQIVWTLDNGNIERVLEAVQIYCKLGAYAR